MHRPLTLAAAVSLLVPSLGVAQQASTRFDAARPTAPVIALEANAAFLAPAEAEWSKERSFLATALHTIGGALVGGWVGYVGSQVALSDWEKDSNGAFSTERSRWVAAGMVVGVIGSRLVGRTSSPAVRPGDVPRPRTGRDILTRAQIERAGATNVYDLVSTLRKEWLVPRGTNSFRETARGSGGGMGAGAQLVSTPGQASVVVYMDEIRIGEIERMREILPNDIMEIRFIGPQEAGYRYGAGHSHGVILLKTSL